MHLTEEMEAYLRDSQAELKELIRTLCAIPAPSHQEEKRAVFCKQWLEQNGAVGVQIDEACNVVFPYHVTEDQPIVVFMAHMDTVFPDLEPMPFREEDNRYYCPGVCDDTAQLAVLMICARYLIQRNLQTECGILFVANSCEEGLGNLKGCREIIKQYGIRIRELVTIDGMQLNHVVHHAVGSHRYRVTVRTEGGHSFGAFGNRNAIHYLSSMIQTLYTVKVPEENGSRTTYNVGTISGGTSVNTIAQKAEMLYEYRSDNQNCLKQMQTIFEQVIATYRAMGIEVNTELLGERPCGGELDPVQRQKLLDRTAAAIRTIVGEEPVFCAGSTDCNIPLSHGIPAVCISGCVGHGAHTREEYLELDHLLTSNRLVMEFLASYLV